MSFLTAARAAQVGLKRPCGMHFAVIAVALLAALSLSCGGSSHHSQNGPNHNAYVTLPDRNSVLLLHINGSNGAITLGAQTPQVLGNSPNGLALLPSKKFLYVANSQANTISIFSIGGDGTLTLTGTPTPDGGAGPHAAVIDPSGQYLLVTNTFSNDISVFSVDSGSGALTPVPGSPFFANLGPGEILIPPSGKFVYVTNPSLGTVTSFTLSNTTGFLTSTGAAAFSGAGASGLTVDGSESFLYVANSSAVNPGSTSIGNISGFTINSTTGVLTPIVGSPFTSKVGSGPSALVVDPNNRFVYATTPGSSFSIWCYTVNSTNGQLTAVNASPFSVTAGGLFALIDHSGNYFYIGSEAGPGVVGYTYSPNTGVPTAITGSPFATGSEPGKMVIAD